MRKVKIMGTGKYIPEHKVDSAELDQMLQLPRGWAEKKSGVKTRYYAKGEHASSMGAKAALQALSDASLELDEIDAIVCASGTMEQPIPCTASLIHQKLAPSRPIPAFDINSTCLSFVTAFDIVSQMIAGGSYEKVLIVSADIASVGINPKQKESYILFGDAAAACVLARAEAEDTCGILGSYMETYSEGAQLTEIRGGGTKNHPNSHPVKEDYLFSMDGQGVFRLSSKHILGFLDKLYANTPMTIQDMDAVIPHQASGMALRIMQKKIGVKQERFIQIIENYGNTIASSIPLTLHEAIQSDRLLRGQKALLLGTSAGLSIGGIVFEY
ncbi:beta-ketoacyl-ACP synthase III [Paenibacillus lutimineralis]|uniref:Beta-ketoacyl-ACP synthase III n=1 Tax=Paenibacillus lutimineralis TaxID=2707005 RepID=A0A3Q9IFC9_9BACL|nr:beta-ketoacyl-ACP synthase III [Paenibacillus lutimineralis]AZS16905.1 beta-ketoacyl-ACP synthase III [Paenibacillus lutimineralis]